MPTEELFGNYMLLSRQADTTTLTAEDSLMLVLDDSEGSETVQYRESDLDYQEADGIIAVELDAGRRLADGGDLVGTDTGDSFVMADAVRIEAYTATDDLWQ